MSQREKRQFIARQIVELEQQRSLVAGHPLMEPLLQQREDELRNSLGSLPVDGHEARTVLFFSGKPVRGSAGIDAQFVSSILSPFLEMVKSQYSAVKHGSIGQRGPRRDDDEARLMLSGTPRGSFGLELSPPSTDDLFAEERLSEVLVQLTRVIEAAGESDEGYLLNLDEVAPRTFGRLPDFFKVLHDSDANLRMQTGDIQFELTNDAVRKAYERVNTSRTVERQVDFDGVFRGATLDTWRFDFRSADGVAISGRIGDELSEDAVAGMLTLANKRCRATLNEIIVTTSGGAMRRRYVLLALSEPAVEKELNLST